MHRKARARVGRCGAQVDHVTGSLQHAFDLATQHKDEYLQVRVLYMPCMRAFQARPGRVVLPPASSAPHGLVPVPPDVPQYRDMVLADHSLDVPALGPAFKAKDEPQPPPAGQPADGGSAAEGGAAQPPPTAEGQPGGEGRRSSPFPFLLQAASMRRVSLSLTPANRRHCASGYLAAAPAQRAARRSQGPRRMSATSAAQPRPGRG